MGLRWTPATGIWVIGNFDSSLATVVNLVDGTFSPPPACMLTEGGTLPNSINFDTGTSALMPGAAINAATHQALLTAAYGAQVALLTLPSGPVRQLTSAMVSGVQGMCQRSRGQSLGSATFPYAIVADSCHNLGYVLDFQRDFFWSRSIWPNFRAIPPPSVPRLRAGIAPVLRPHFCVTTTKA